MKNNKQPLVSVIIPTYNRSQYVLRAINFCLKQTHKNIEIIVIDDCSKDNTEELINELHDKRIIYIKNKKNLKAPASRNKGMEIAKGDYIQFLDDDDIIFPKKIEEQIKKFNSSKIRNLGVVTCDLEVDRYDVRKKQVVKNRKKGFIYKDLLMKYCVFGIHSMLIKKEALKGIKFDTKFVANQEYDFMIQIAKNNAFDFVPKVLGSVLDSTNHITKSFKNKIIATWQIFTKYHKEYLEAGSKVYFHNLFRFSYLFFKFFIGLIFGWKIYKFLRL
jgi:glycosyltransferase involved in cell wall biosynthesis